MGCCNQKRTAWQEGQAGGEGEVHGAGAGAGAAGADAGLPGAGLPEAGAGSGSARAGDSAGLTGLPGAASSAGEAGAVQNPSGRGFQAASRKKSSGKKTTFRMPQFFRGAVTASTRRWVILFLVVPFFQACPNNTTNGVIAYTFKSIAINDNGLTRLSVTCPAGGQMVGGGFTVYPNTPVDTRANFPSSTNTWEVDINNTNANGAATLTVYLYYYTGDKDLGMEINSVTQTVSGPKSGAISTTTPVSVEKKYATSVITSGGFQIPADVPSSTMTVSGSFPTLNSSAGDDVTGWTNNATVLLGRSATITSYVMYSNGTGPIGSTTPVFDGGQAIQKNFTGISPGKTVDVIGNDLHFCTGGGYNFNSSVATEPVNIFQNNAGTQSANHTTNDVFLGWQFDAAPHNVTLSDSWSVYALQIRLHGAGQK
jgi:hypothetical protein